MIDEVPALTQRPAWQALAAHYAQVRPVHLRQLFADDPRRGERFAAEGVGLYPDYSKHRITDGTLKLLLDLAAVDSSSAYDRRHAHALGRSGGPRLPVRASRQSLLEAAWHAPSADAEAPAAWHAGSEKRCAARRPAGEPPSGSCMEEP